MRVVISQKAKHDIRRNAEWWAENHSRTQAEKWFFCVYGQLEAIGNSPASYGLSAENGVFPFDLRDALVGTGRRKLYRAIFRIEDDVVTIYRVVRAAEGIIQADELE